MVFHLVRQVYLFIKSFQKTGGALLVGFNGNPNLADEYFDASQSPTNVMFFETSVEYNNLQKLGFKVEGISASDSFSDDYNEKNAIPMEYQFDPVGERVDIYNEYTDETYQTFIDKAKNIFMKYNEDKRCNIKNKKLLLDPNDGETCYHFEEDKFAHGGFECGSNGYWSNDTCKKYYCDFGYYYDLKKEKCVIDVCTNDPNEIKIDLTGEYNNIIIINETNNKEYIFNLKNNKYIYFFKVEGKEGYIHYAYENPCPNLCVIQSPNINEFDSIYLNYYRNATNENIVIYISSVEFDYNLISTVSLKYLDDEINYITPLNIKNFFYIFQGYSDYVSYFQTFAKTTKIKCALYEFEMTELDILNMNEKYFIDCNDKLMSSEKGKIYIAGISTLSPYDLNKPLKILVQPKNMPDYIELYKDKEEDEKSFLFLSKSDKKYTLDFQENERITIMQLSRCTSNSEIIITDEETNNTITLNSNNLYHNFSGENYTFEGKVTIEVKNDALIEFLVHFPNNTDILPNKEYNKYKIKGNTVLKLEKNTSGKNIYITIYSGKNKPFKYGVISGYTLGNYFHYSTEYNIDKIEPYDSSDTIELKVNNNNLNEGEYIYIMLIFDQKEISDESYSIHVTKTEKFNIDIFNVGFPDDKSEIVINSIIKLIEQGYIYNDILKNPPNDTDISKIDIVKELKKVNVNNKKFFDFYREIRRIISQEKDRYFNILPKVSPNFYNIEKLHICLPFSFYIKGNTKETAQIFIEINRDCLDYYSSQQRDFIISHLDKHLAFINKIDPFKFIENLQSEFSPMHNKDAQFTYSLENTHKLFLLHNPFTQEQISNIEFIFEGDNDNKITLDYYIKNEEENNNNININNNDSKEWKYSTKLKNGFKCLVDNDKEVNVFILESLNFLGEENYLDDTDVILNCTKEFYNNSFPIIGIINNNEEGDIKLALYLEQLLQIKLVQRTYFAVKKSDLVKNEINKNIQERKDIINPKTGKEYINFDEMGEIIDEYGNNITLNRTKVFQMFNKTILKRHKKIREELYKLNNIKRPSDIIIFTDGISSGASSFLIKGLQERGGAIIVGYKGNPKSDQMFDATQSASSFTSFKDSDEYKNLLECGFSINEISFYQSFGDSYQEENPIPREFKIFPVDERVNIYHNYNDSYYNEFIDKALEIFDKYNNQGKCNKNNLLLTLEQNDDNTCKEFENDKHSHGGYQCKEDGTWSNICVPYYCDLGYIFNTYSKKCEKDIFTEDDEEQKPSDNIEPENEPETEKEDFPVWAIILIVIGSLLLILIILIIIKYIRSKDKVNNDLISPMSQANNNSNVELTEKN